MSRAARACRSRKRTRWASTRACAAAATARGCIGCCAGFEGGAGRLSKLPELATKPARAPAFAILATRLRARSSPLALPAPFLAPATHMDILAPLLLERELAMSAMLMPAPHMLCRSHSGSAASRPTLEETADGWTITALMPGMDASQVSVETLQEEDGASHIWLHAEPRFKTELRCVPAQHAAARCARRARHRAPRCARSQICCLGTVRKVVRLSTRQRALTRPLAVFPRRLPRNADSARCSASLVNGVLTVAIPKKAAETHTVAVEPAPLPDELPEPRAQVALALPGLAAADLSVTISRDRNTLLHVKGSSSTFGDVHETLRLPERANAAAARASMVNGVFSFTVPVEPEPTAEVPVLAAAPADAMEADKADGAEKDKAPQQLLLLEAAAPGLCAADFKASVSGRTLTLAADKSALGGRRVRRTVLLPPHTAPGSLVITCVNGLLRAVAPRPQPPARTAVQVSATQTAALLKAPGTPPSAPAAAPAVDAPMEEEPAAAAAQ